MKDYRTNMVWLTSEHYASLAPLPGCEKQKEKFVSILESNRRDIEVASPNGVLLHEVPEVMDAWVNHNHNLLSALTFVEKLDPAKLPAGSTIAQAATPKEIVRLYLAPYNPEYVYVATLFENPAWGLRDPNNRDHYRGVRVGLTFELAELKAKSGIKGFRSGSYKIEKVGVEYVG